jgi:ABC-2 type transport system ATP-binding protein
VGHVRRRRRRDDVATSAEDQQERHAQSLLRHVPDHALPILHGERLTVSRGGRRIYDQASVSFGPGITAILGPNGAGKTTLIEGLLSPMRLGAGVLTLDGAQIPRHLSVPEFLRRVGHMPQEWKFFGSFTVQESVEYVAWLKQVPRASIREAATKALRATDMLDHRATKIRKLSGGMRQRVGLAEAFVNDPRLVLLDEPTVGLDPGQRALFRRFVQSNSHDRAVVLSTHLTDDVDAIADRVLVVAEGSVLFDGSPSALAALGTAASGTPSLEAGYLHVVGPVAQIGAT